MLVRFALVFTLVAAGCQPGADSLEANAQNAPTLASDDDKAFYALGLEIAASLESFALEEEELERIVLGLRDGATGQPERIEDRRRFSQRAGEIRGERVAAVAAQEREAAAEYMAAMAAEDGAEATESGVVVQMIEEGTGASPSAASSVRVQYHGTLRDGTVFDSTRLRGGTPVSLKLNGVIPCWQEAIPLMKVGGKAKISCPSDRAYGDRGAGEIPGGAALTFEVELVEILDS